VVKKDADNTPTDTFNLALGTFTGGLAGGSRTSAVFTITERADTTGPVVRIVKPVANAAVSAANLASVALEATATDPVGVVSVAARVNGGSPVAVPLVNGLYKVDLTGLENGKSTIEVAATDANGNVGRASVSVMVSIANAAIVGAYNGLFEADAEEDAKLAALVNGPSLNHNGLLRVDVTAGQRFTGTVTMAGVKVSIKGLFLSDGTAVFGDGEMSSTTVELLKKGVPDDFSLGFLSLQLDAPNKRITGSLTTDRDEEEIVTFATVSADQNLYTDKTPPVAPFVNVPTSIANFAPGENAGNYTVLFQNKVAPNNGYAASAYPLGDGAGTIVVDKKGVVKVVAKLADGTAVSYSNALSLQNEFPMYVQLYANKGFIIGNVQFDPTATSADASATVSWFRPTGVTITGNYLAGWKKGIDLDLVASKFVKPAAGATNNVLGLAPATALQLRTQGALGNTANQGTINALNVVTVQGAVSGSTGANTLKVSIDTKTGLLKAPSEFLYGSGNVKVSLVGAVFQKTSAIQGYFLYAPARTNPVGTAESGYFEVARPVVP
jgi:hypothetical protein